ncbi:putative phage-associated protein [Spirosoma oryzae]|uniref:Putative phage-associated protein n=1 Tax=Spirosoma oryzae TaxID=1469603 RepID=A0A2T0TMT3_9BACT|nr:type II toxin-antitoxin system antitoxin SocA domain-containing protein [Spirosoma oryzae]PRY46965.1 putative phage-associated protein [Spirosoma oryzae]
MTTARDVAEYILQLADSEVSDNDVTNLKLQKLVYYVQGFHLAMFDKTVFSDPIAPWQYGPVVSELYHTYKENGGSVIKPTAEYTPTEAFSEEQENLIKEVFNVYGQFSAWKLRDMTHQELPWIEADELKLPEIKVETMRTFFKDHIN